MRTPPTEQELHPAFEGDRLVRTHVRGAVTLLDLALARRIDALL